MTILPRVVAVVCYVMLAVCLIDAYSAFVANKPMRVFDEATHAVMFLMLGLWGWDLAGRFAKQRGEREVAQ